jgi:hypothetical protein
MLNIWREKFRLILSYLKRTKFLIKTLENMSKTMHVLCTKLFLWASSGTQEFLQSINMCVFSTVEINFTYCKGLNSFHDQGI